MKKLIDKIKDKLWPIGLVPRVVAGQFTTPRGASMLLHSSEQRLEFRFHPTTSGLSWVQELRLSITRGDAQLANIISGEVLTLNRREKLLVGQAVQSWLSLDGIDGQVEVAK